MKILTVVFDVGGGGLEEEDSHEVNYYFAVQSMVCQNCPLKSVETPENDEGELLLKDFLGSYRENTFDPTKVETSRNEFPIKHINIVHPLKENNFGGRLSKGNFFRIKFALAYGVQNIEEILMLPGETTGEELKKFFMSTLERNGRGQRPDVQDTIPVFGSGRLANLGRYCDRFLIGLQYAQWYTNYTIHFPIRSSPPSSLSLIHKNSRGTNILYPGQSCYPNIQLHVIGYGVQQMLSSGTYNQSRGTCLYIPDMGLVEKAKFQGAGAYIRYMGTEERVKPRGSASYFTSMVNHTYREMHSSARGENLKSLSHDVSLETGQSGKNNCLSLEEYPYLPACNNPCIQKTMKIPR